MQYYFITICVNSSKSLQLFTHCPSFVSPHSTKFPALGACTSGDVSVASGLLDILPGFYLY